MARATHPKPYQMAVGLGRLTGRFLEKPVRRYEVVSRVYDRQSGNFKAIGWRILVKYNDIELTSDEFILLDSQLPNYIQSTL